MKKIIILLLCSAFSFTSRGQSVVQGEYFIDNDLGVGNNTQVTFTPSPDNSFPFMIDLSSYSPGYHKLYIRTKDSDGKWSFTSRRNIEVFASAEKTTMAGGEYFIDNDPGFGLATPIIINTPDSIILQNFSAIASALSEGYHKLYGRLMDNLGRWSQTFRRNIEVYKDVNNKVINGEYFFKTDNGFGDCSPVAFAVPAADGSFNINIPKNTIPAGTDTLFVRVRDDIESRWSITQTFNNIQIALPLTLLNFSAVKQSNIAQLNWQTTNEVNTAYFNIQRSSDGINFTNVGVVNAKNQNGINTYSYPDDIAAISATILYYRLQEVDVDDNLMYSKIVTIYQDKTMLNYTVYPNPASDYFNLISSEPGDLRGAQISIVDLSGKELLKQSLKASANQRINISSLAKGMYIIKIVKGTGTVTRKLIKE